MKMNLKLMVLNLMKQISQNQKIIQIINQIINQGQMQEKKRKRC